MAYRGAMENVAEWFGGLDIYVFDQVVRGGIRPGDRIVDAGCGGGRNARYFLKAGYEIYGVDADEGAVEAARRMAGEAAPGRERNFSVGKIEAMAFPDGFADVVIANTVLHFARDEKHFRQMVFECWRILKPGGLFFARLASLDGMEGLARPIEGRRYGLPDGTERFLVDEKLMALVTEEMGGRLAEPLKTTIVHGQRSMATWVARKGAAE